MDVFVLCASLVVVEQIRSGSPPPTHHSKEKPWHSFTVAKRSGKRVPNEPICHECWTWHASTMSWMPWSDFVALFKRDTKFAKEVRTAIDIRSGKQQRDFAPESVAHLLSVGYRVEVAALPLTKQEVEEQVGEGSWDRILHSGQKPTQLFLENGQKTATLLVKDPSQPRKVIIYSDYGFEKASLAQELSACSMPSQGDRLVKHLLQKRKTDTPMLGSSRLQSIEDLRGISRGLHGEKDGADSGESEGEVQVETRDASGALIVTPSPGKIKEKLGSVFRRAASAASGLAPSARRSAAASVDDGTSGIDDDGEALNKSAAHWVMKLDLCQIMSGRKLGRQKGFAIKARDRLYEQGLDDDAKTLNRHLGIVNHAECLTAASIPNLTEAELDVHLKEILPLDLPIPTDVMYAIFWKRTEEDRKRALNADWDALQRLSIAMCPWNEEAPPQAEDDLGISERDGASAVAPMDTKGIEFDPLAPKLWQLSGSTQELCKVFQQTLIKKLLNVLLARGEEAAKEAFEVSYFFCGKYEEVPEIHELEVCMFGCLQLWRTVCELGKPDPARDFAGSVEWSFGPQHVGHVGVCRNVLSETPYWRKRYGQFVQEQVFANLRAQMPKAVNKIRAIAIADDNASDSLTALDDHLKFLDSCMAHLRKGLTKWLEDELRAKIEEVATSLLTEGAGSTSTTSAIVDQLIDLLKKGFDIFGTPETMRDLMCRAKDRQANFDLEARQGDLRSVCDLIMKDTSGQHVPVADTISAWRALLGRCSGIVPQAAADIKVVTDAATRLEEILVSQDFAQGDLNRILLDLAGHLDDAIGSRYKASARLLDLWWGAVEAFNQFMASGTTPQQREEAVGNKEQLKVTMQRKNKLNSALAKAVQSEVKDHIKSKSKTIMDKMHAEGLAVQSMADSELKTTTKAIKDIVGGDTLGCQWDGVALDADWATVIDHANRHMMAINPKALDTAVAELATATNG